MFQEQPASRDDLRYLPLSYDHHDSRNSALALILALRPDWEGHSDSIDLVRFTDGITNTLLKAVHRLPGQSPDEVEQGAILLRAYGKDTHVLIDRDRECRSHLLLARYGLAPPLLARFENGLLYRFIQGRACAPQDLRRPAVWRSVAERLGQWHAVLPPAGLPGPPPPPPPPPLSSPPLSSPPPSSPPPSVSPTPTSLWTVLQKWTAALPAADEAEAARKTSLRHELAWIEAEFRAGGDRSPALVFAHCDLLSGNVIVSPALADAAPADEPPGTQRSTPTSPSPSPSPSSLSQMSDESPSPCRSVSFIDFEYTTPAPAAFDIANHFAEWAGFDCDFSVLPTRAQRRDFLSSYVDSYRHHSSSSAPARLKPPSDPLLSSAPHPRARGSVTSRRAPSPNGIITGTDTDTDDEASERVRDGERLHRLEDEVDRFRGLPGFYWGVWALIQATISQIDFDYATYAQVRLSEYWHWKAEYDGSRQAQRREIPLREQRWAQDV